MSNKHNPCAITMRHKMQDASWWEGKIMRMKKQIVGANGTFLPKGRIVIVMEKNFRRLTVRAAGRCKECGNIVQMSKIKFSNVEFAGADQAEIK